jgi:hypothetical protein
MLLTIIAVKAAPNYKKASQAAITIDQITHQNSFAEGRRAQKVVYAL